MTFPSPNVPLSLLETLKRNEQRASLNPMSKGTTVINRKATHSEENHDIVMSDTHFAGSELLDAHVVSPTARDLEVEISVEGGYESASEDEKSDDLPWSSSPVQERDPPTKSPLPQSSPPRAFSPDSPAKPRNRMLDRQDLPPDSSGFRLPSQSPSKRSNFAVQGQTRSDVESNIVRHIAVSSMVSPHGTDEVPGTSTTSTLFSTAVQPLKTPKPNSSYIARSLADDTFTSQSSNVKAMAEIMQERWTDVSQSSPHRIHESPHTMKKSSQSRSPSGSTRKNVVDARLNSQGSSGLTDFTVRSSPARLVPSTFHPPAFARGMPHGIRADGADDSNVPPVVIAACAEEQIQNEIESSLLANSQIHHEDKKAAPSTPSHHVERTLPIGSPYSHISSVSPTHEGGVPIPIPAITPNKGRVKFIKQSSTYQLSQEDPVLEDPAEVAAMKRRQFLKHLTTEGDVAPGNSKKLKHTHISSEASQGELRLNDKRVYVRDETLPNTVIEERQGAKIQILDLSLPSPFSQPRVETRQPSETFPELTTLIAASTRTKALGVGGPVAEGPQETREAAAAMRHNPDVNLFNDFREEYPEYTGDIEHFLNLCREIYFLDRDDEFSHWNWDDYVIANRIRYAPYAEKAIVRGLSPLGYSEWYRRNTEHPQHIKGVLLPSVLSCMTIVRAEEYVNS
jgi:hypothetical protein